MTMKPGGEQAREPEQFVNLPKQYQGRWTYEYNEKRQCFQVCTGGYCVAETEDSEVADTICNLKNAAHCREAEQREWESWGIVEIAVRNQSVADYVKHWESRCLAAEASLRSAKAILQEIRYDVSWGEMRVRISEILSVPSAPTAREE